MATTNKLLTNETQKSAHAILREAGMRKLPNKLRYRADHIEVELIETTPGRYDVVEVARG